MENKMFLCEMEGCFDQATKQMRIEFQGETEDVQFCVSCAEFLSKDSDIKVLLDSNF